MKKVLVLVLTICLALTETSYGGKEEIKNEATLTLVENEESWNIVKETIDSFFAVNSEERMSSLPDSKVNSTVRNDLVARLRAIEQMEDAIGCVYDEVVFTSYIDSASFTERGTIDARVYVTTAINYHYPNIDDSDDYALIGTYHDMELEQSDNGLKVIRDSFDERSILGVASSDVLSADIGNSYKGGIDNKANSPLSTQSLGQRTTFSYTASAIRTAIQYATNYCGYAQNVRRYHSIGGINSGNGSQSYISHGTSNYNSSYFLDGITNNNKDCANFVSQCLEAAGLRPDTIWYFSAYNAKWVGAYELVNYLTGTIGVGTSSLVNTSYSNVYTGNPVYWLTDSGEAHPHIMLCTGSNTAGVPVVCGHTNDVYRVPISAFTGHILRTVVITSSETHSLHTQVPSPWYYDSTYHYHVCQYCEYPDGYGVHVPGIYGDCDVCGAMIP